MESKKCNIEISRRRFCKNKCVPMHNVCGDHLYLDNLRVVPHVRVSPTEYCTVYINRTCPGWSIETGIGAVITERHGDITYTVGRQIAHGGYGFLYEVIPSTVQEYSKLVLKIIKDPYNVSANYKPYMVDVNDFYREFNFYHTYQDRIKEDKNVAVKYIDMFFVFDRTGYHGAILMPMLDNSAHELFHRGVLSSLTDFEYIRIWLYFCKWLARAINDLFAAHMYHSDIKAGNILYKTDCNHIIHFYLSDFGLSGYFPSENDSGKAAPHIVCVGTGVYAAPEWMDSNGSYLFDPVDDEDELRAGILYAVCKTLLTAKDRNVFSKSERLKEFINILREGTAASIEERKRVSLTEIAKKASELEHKLIPANNDSSR